MEMLINSYFSYVKLMKVLILYYLLLCFYPHYSKLTSFVFKAAVNELLNTYNLKH